MPYRKDPLVVGEVYHVFTRSIAGFETFNDESEYTRMFRAICYYQDKEPESKLSLLPKSGAENIAQNKGEKRVKILAYCLMPTHIHLILEQLDKEGISRFMKAILKSYTQYFNLKHKRKGPLWEGRFKSVLVTTDEQLLHLTRYVHLNPVTSFFINNPEEWRYSSYREYIGLEKGLKICQYGKYIDMDAETYKHFVDSRIDYQRQLHRIKHLVLE